MSAQVAIIMGSKSDLPVLQGAFQMLDKFGVTYTARVLSAHRTPDEAAAFAKNAEDAGCKVIICAAGMAAHLGGVFAAHTVLPVIGIPVATVTAGKAGGKNAALYAISILAVQDAGLREQLKAFRREQAEQVLKADAELQEELKGN